MANTFDVLGEIAAYIASCRDCGLCETRTNTVPGEGNKRAKIMIIGEGPGQNEDLQGRPFIGKAGDLLNEAFRRAGINRNDVFITNAVKCRPPGNRNPSQEEMDKCYPYLINQICYIKPEIVVILGKVAAEYLLQRPVKITKENGKLEVRSSGLRLMTVLHPAYVLRNQTPEIRESFFQAITNARNIAYGNTTTGIHAGSVE